jgi:hypothetical protein
MTADMWKPTFNGENKRRDLYDNTGIELESESLRTSETDASPFRSEIWAFRN